MRRTRGPRTRNALRNRASRCEFILERQFTMTGTPPRRPATALAMAFLTVEHLSKRYTIGSKRPRELWALRDVGFTVERGEILGIIGPNGAGKTTLLKVLSRVTPPTEGRVVGHGRVMPLLALGAGFQPDLSGRENVFLN